eukprot:4337976-Amphidinium_carterae.2
MKFNEGGCSLPCPGKRAHQCSKCLQTGHTALACPGRKGKGRGKGSNKRMRGRKTPDGKWATAASAMYPSELNRALAKAISSTVAQPDSPKVLSLIGGRQDREDGLHVYLNEQRIGCVTVDIVNKPRDENNLLNDLLWQQLLDRVKSKEFSFLMAAPVCTTWSRARQLRREMSCTACMTRFCRSLLQSRDGAVESWHALRP